MNTNMSLATSQSFGNVPCDFWSDKENSNFWMTRDQIGTALEYLTDPAKSISVIHYRHKDRLDKFSGVVKLKTPSGTQDCTVYSFRGVFEICRWSRQAKANEFMDWVWDIIDGLRTGKYTLSSDSAVIPQAELLQMFNEMETKYNDLKEYCTNSYLSLAYELDDAKREMLANMRGSLSMNRVAKGLGLGRNTMMDILRQNDILFKDGNDNIPYEKFIKSGHFIVKSKPNKNGEIHSTTYVTAKGITYIFEIVNEWNKLS